METGEDCNGSILTSCMLPILMLGTTQTATQQGVTQILIKMENVITQPQISAEPFSETKNHPAKQLTIV